MFDVTAAEDKQISGPSINETEMDDQTSLLLSRDDEDILLVKDMKIEGRMPQFVS